MQNLLEILKNNEVVIKITFSKDSEINRIDVSGGIGVIFIPSKQLTTINDVFKRAADGVIALMELAEAPKGIQPMPVSPSKKDAPILAAKAQIETASDEVIEQEMDKAAAEVKSRPAPKTEEAIRLPARKGKAPGTPVTTEHIEVKPTASKASKVVPEDGLDAEEDNF